MGAISAMAFAADYSPFAVAVNKPATVIDPAALAPRAGRCQPASGAEIPQPRSRTMSQFEVERFAKDVKANSALLAETTKDDRMEAVVRVAARHGYSFTLEEVKAFVKAKAAGKDLSDAELEAAAGGVANCVGLPQDCGNRRRNP
jgi:predicted ribosomally synthesized peptide with nif11-like leader